MTTPSLPSSPKALRGSGWHLSTITLAALQRTVPDPGVVWIDAHGDFNTEKTTEPGYLTDLPPGPLFLHLDVDIADPADLPGLQFPAPGGPGRQQLIDAVATLTRTDRIAAVDVGLTWRPDPSAERRRADYMRPILALLGGGMSG